MQYVTEAILLAVKNFGDADKMVTFLSRDRGKLKALAYGCRRPRSQLSGAVQLFSHLEMNLNQGRGIDTIKSCQLLTPFRALREDIEKMAYASFVAELAAEFCPENYEQRDIFELCLNAFSALEKRNPRLGALVFAAKLLSLTGFEPNYEACVFCGKKRQADGWFSLEHSGFCCAACQKNENILFTEKAAEFILRLRDFEWQQPLSVSGAALVGGERVLISYLEHVLEKPLKSLSFIAEISSLDKMRQKR
jgi:DNA repair protein RecO (recombination protein O)